MGALQISEPQIYLQLFNCTWFKPSVCVRIETIIFLVFFSNLSTISVAPLLIENNLCFFSQDFSVFSELKRRSQLRDAKKEKDKSKKKRASMAAPQSSALRKRKNNAANETPAGQQGSDDVDEVIEQ